MSSLSLPPTSNAHVNVSHKHHGSNGELDANMLFSSRDRGPMHCNGVYTACLKRRQTSIFQGPTLRLDLYDYQVPVIVFSYNFIQPSKKT